MLTNKFKMLYCNIIIVAKDINRFMLKQSSEYFMYTDMQACNIALFAKCTIITQMNFLSGYNDVI
jgi:hypothetical protein